MILLPIEHTGMEGLKSISDTANGKVGNDKAKRCAITLMEAHGMEGSKSIPDILKMNEANSKIEIKQMEC